MNTADVLINLPNKNFDNSYKYQVPEQMKDQIAFGKRVLVELGRKKVEGFIIAMDKQEPANEELKPLIRVLDSEPVFDHSLYELACWLAENCICPVASAINAMIPRTLVHKRAVSIIPYINKDETGSTFQQQLLHTHASFFNMLWEQGEITLYEARKHLHSDILQDLEYNGLINISGSYAGYRESKAGYCYKIKEFDPLQDMPALMKKAARQAMAMEMLIQNGKLKMEYLDKLIPSSSIKALIKKNYIEIVRDTGESFALAPQLNREQQIAFEAIAQSLTDRSRQDFLLYGVTGSGKTEVYLRAAEKAIQLGKTAIVLVPEIALTRHLVEVFSSRIKNLAVLHSKMSAGERYTKWKQIRQGEINLVLGTRSAIFAPLPSLGLIIIDEEQEPSYKQDETPKYHALNVARQRAQMESAVLLIGSATPSVDSFYNAQKQKSTILYLKKRVKDAQMPLVEIERMKYSAANSTRSISPKLQQKLHECMNRGEQSILFINRRGFAPMTLCTECGKIAACPVCSVGMTYHRDIDRNVCHYCNFQSKVPSHCSGCGSSHLKQIGTGTQRVETEIKSLFPDARIERLDLDNSRKSGVQKDILSRMKRQEIDILIGTQMVAKGLDFPSVSLVGIVDADSMLNIPDFRAGERCFQLLVQAAGRAGRANYPGEVIIQTYNPLHPIIQMAARQDYIGFYREEIRQRKILKYPPFTQILRLLISSEREETAQEMVMKLAEQIEQIIDASEEELEILGPAPCPIYKIRNRYRWQLLIKCENMLLLKSIGRYIMSKASYKLAKLEMDINPLTTM
ncbi:MAG: primosomal protein N' [Syntrophomonadaceae bacterium]|nr:primosomal protein N' [Syntrophomonadaceae bacterium]